MKLTADNVQSVMREVLFRDDEIIDNKPPDDAVIVEGIMGSFALHPQRLKDKADDVASMLAELPDEFHADKGGGMSFLNACYTRNGDHWAEHPTMGELFVLGVGTGHAKLLMPRELWPALPGGMPYYSVFS